MSESETWILHVFTQQDSTQKQLQPAGISAQLWFVYSFIHSHFFQSAENMKTNKERKKRKEVRNCCCDTLARLWLYFCQTLVKHAHASWESLRVQDLREGRRNHWDGWFQQAEQKQSEDFLNQRRECALNSLTDRNMETSARSWTR